MVLLGMVPVAADAAYLALLDGGAAAGFAA
jgi:hypothetical protein